MIDVKEQLYSLNKISKKSVALYHKVALSIGISDSSLGILYALLEAPCSQHDLCNDWYIPKQTINSTISVLRKKGLVELTPVANARNKKNIVLTEAGRSFAENTVGILRKAETAALEELTPDEREAYVRLNKKYNQSLTERIDSFLENLGNESD